MKNTLSLLEITCLKPPKFWVGIVLLLSEVPQFVPLNAENHLSMLGNTKSLEANIISNGKKKQSVVDGFWVHDC